MELTLKRLLEHAEFKKYRGKGYDPTEVDDFLDRAAAMAGKVEVQLTQALEQARAGGGGAPAAPDPAEVEAEVERRVAERLAAAPVSAGGPSEDEIAEEARRTLTLAQRTADAAVREAREDADKIVTSAKEQASTLVADAEARSSAMLADAETRSSALLATAEEREATSRAQVEEEAARERREARQRLAGEIAELEGTRETLRADVNVLERHVEEQRSQLGSTLAELQQILDDPSGFRMAPVPTLAEPELPDFSDLAEADEPAAEAPAPEPVVEPSAAPEPEPTPEPVAEVEVEVEPAPQAEVEPEAEVDTAARMEVPEAEAAPSDPPAPQTLVFDEVDHEAPGIDDRLDSGPPTAPITAVDLGFDAPAPAPAGAEDDAFLAELRKAMVDDEPLGPRDQQDAPTMDPMFDDDDDRRGWRFGRRR